MPHRANSEPTDYKPSAFYFRRALRAIDDPAKLRAIGMTILRELETVKAWAREEHGLIPPKLFVMQSEVDEKPWLQVRSRRGARRR